MHPYQLKQLADKVHDAIDEYCVNEFAQEHREHLGASIIGHDCDRYIWYAFRWIKLGVFSGRMLRLFDRGNAEEARVIRWLKGAGFQVWTHDHNGEQFKIVGANGHYGGSTDSVARTPWADYPDAFLCEYKTHNQRSFAHLQDKKLKISKPRHYTQMCSYGKAFGLKYGLYFGVNKNDDDLHIEAVELDYTLANDMHRRAEDIIYATVPPPKIAMQADYFECKMCPFSGPCHHNTDIDRNCRSCVNAVPTDNAQWRCNHFEQIIPPDFIPKGCDRWQPIVNR